jgi:antagonist of KipI
MSHRSVHVLRPGLHTSVQDLGRWGFQADGVSVAGPMDPFSHRLANALAGNARQAATLEITLVGPALGFDSEALAVVAGADFDVGVNGVPVGTSHPFVVPSGGTLDFGARRRGARAYLAVCGGFDVPVVLGSRATHAPSGLGGWKGRALQAGDRLPLGEAPPRSPMPRPGAPVVEPAGPPTLRVLGGPDIDRFLPDALDALQSGPYEIDAASNRMGFRLRGPALRHSRGADLISDVTPAGTLQVPGSGQPILLMADRQTTGGYPRLATVITADLGLAGQRAPGEQIAFRVCSVAEALAALIARESALIAVEDPA